MYYFHYAQKIGPGWVLYNLAGLYWRIIGNNYQGVECIRRSLYLVPEEYKDVPLVNLANILYRWGRFEDAVTVMRDALAVNDLEVQKSNGTSIDNIFIMLSFFGGHTKIFTFANMLLYINL